LYRRSVLGRGPMRLGWSAVVRPSLALNYFGQGAPADRPDCRREPLDHLAPG